MSCGQYLGRAVFIRKWVQTEQRIDCEGAGRNEMLVRQIAMPCSLIIPLGVGRIDHPVLLIEHDITGNEPSADLKDFVVSGKLKERPRINQRQPSGARFSDCL